MNGCTRIVAFAASVLVAATPAWGQQSKGSPEDEAAIRHVLEVLQEAVDRHDAKRLAALFSQDAEYVDPYRIVSGQPAIERLYASFFSGRARSSRVLERTAPSLRFTRPDRAIVNTTFTMRQARKRAGSMKWRTTTVLVKQGDRWLIVHHAEGVPEPDAGLTILLKNGSAVEVRTAQQLLGLLQTYDVSKWLFTRKVRIQERVIPHSKPVLTLNARRRDTDLEILKLLSTFVHEQIHRSLSDWPERWKLVEPAMSEFQTLFPARADLSNYLHLIVCHLEYEAMKELVGDDKARQVMASFGHYKWVYRTIVTEHLLTQADVRLGEVVPRALERGWRTIRETANPKSVFSHPGSGCPAGLAGGQRGRIHHHRIR